MDSYVFVSVTMSDEPEYETFNDHWAEPVALRDAPNVHFDVTHEEKDEFGLGIPVREVTMSGTVTSEELEAFRSEWQLYPDEAEPALGFLGDLGDGIPRLYADERHVGGGQGEFNVGGMDPVLTYSVSIVGPDAHPAE